MKIIGTARPASRGAGGVLPGNHDITLAIASDKQQVRAMAFAIDPAKSPLTAAAARVGGKRGE